MHPVGRPSNRMHLKGHRVTSELVLKLDFDGMRTNMTEARLRGRAA